MGISSSTSGTGFHPNPDEISKAVVLASLAYLDNAERKAAFESRYPNIGLENIVMAPDFILGECKQNNSTTLFVAFRWRFCIQDVFSLNVAGMNDFTESYGAAVGKDVRGLFHNGLFQRTINNLPSMSYFKDFKAAKIIFAGHGLAGSLAHFFLTCYMLNTREEATEAKRHISIGFGSPNFCDSDAKLFCGKNMELDKRMFTLLNDADPVPWLLTGIRMTVTSNPESLESTMAEKLSSCLDRLNSCLNPVNSKEKIEIEANVLDSLNTFVKEMQSIGQSKCPRYVSVGSYGKGKELKSINPVTGGVILTDVNAWYCHRVECYVEEFSIFMKEGECPIRNFIEESGPCIHACSLNIYHGPKSREGVIAVRGLALTERKELRVVPHVGGEWKVECSNDSSIILSRDLSENEALAMTIGKNDENTKQTHLSLYVRTCFGSIEADVQLEDAWRDGYVSYALNRAMGRLLLMQQSEGFTESDEYRKAYGALECVFRNPLDLSEKKKREYSETVKLQLTAPVETPIPNNLSQNLKDGYNFAESTQGLPRKSYVILSTSLRSCPEDLCPVIPGNSCISRFANQNESSSNEQNSYVYCICDNKLRKLNYLDILRTIYCLLSGDTESNHQQSVDAMFYEEKIYTHVHRHGQAVRRRQGLPEGIEKDITDRAWKIYKIIGAYKLLEGFRMVAFIGPENVGKTTLISSILGENVGDVGFTTHTSAATVYGFVNDIFIIDFPGTDAGEERPGLSKVWEYYEKVADLCIVVVNFGGDTSRAAQKFLRIARSRMCENVVLVINRVDSVLNGSRNSPVWIEYSSSKVKQLRMSFAESCGLPIERVFLSVSRARQELEETTRHLLEERPSIMMKEEITRELRSLLCGTQATFF